MPMGLGLGLGISSGGASMVASGDFTNIATNNAADGVYTLNGATVAITDIIDTENDYGAFDPVVDIDAGGIKSHSGGFTAIYMKDPLLSSLIATGFTLVVELFYGADMSVNCNAHDDDQGPNLSYVETQGQVRLLVGGPGPGYQTLAVNDEVPPEDEICKVAMTFVDSGISYSLNGLPIHTLAVDPLRSGWTHIGITMGSGGAANRIRSFAYYEPVADADLPTLSALD
jgi:hypothetical protein